MSDPRQVHDDELIDVLRSLTVQDHARSPVPEGVWNAISAATVADDEIRSIVASSSASGMVAGRRRGSDLRFVRGLVLGTAAAAAIAGAVWWTARPEPDHVIFVAGLSSAGLDGAPQGVAGTADIVERDGTQTLHLAIPDISPSGDEYLEVWLLKPDVSGLVSLGARRADDTYAIPAGLSLQDYSVVDISAEPYDGDPAHSGASLLRGQLGDPSRDS